MMFPKSRLLSLLAASSALGHVLLSREDEHYIRCQTESPTKEQMDRVLAMEKHKRMKQGGSLIPRQDLVIDLAFNVLASGPTAEEGYIPAEIMEEQLQIVEDGFAQVDIYFNFLGTEYRINATEVTGPEIDYKRSMRRGDYRTLNVFFVHNWGGAGRCTIPVMRYGEPDFEILDGCIVSHPRALPGVGFSCCNEGKTAIHEMGHWFGLWHTFESGCGSDPFCTLDGCTGQGDEVEDTPAQKSPSYGCRETQNTCFADEPGDLPDPVYNYMGYEYDWCIREFTPGQGERMRMIYDEYRRDHPN